MRRFSWTRGRGARHRAHSRAPLQEVLLAAFALAVFGCGREPRPNLLLITTDTTRADHLGCYGYDRPTSPRLDAFAAEAVRFEQAFSHAPITLPAHTSLFSGTFPVFHGVRDNGRFVVPEEVVTLAELLRERGYRTAAFVSAFVLDSRFGLDQGFEVYDDSYTAEWSEEKLRDARIYNQMVTDRPADQTTGRALAWLREQSAEPFFLWVHYYDPHQRYAPPRPYDQIFHDNLYDGEIAFMDDQIGELLDAFRERRLWDDTAVVVTADHGEGLGQHGETTHAALTYDSTLRVPLIVKPPATSAIAPREVADGVSHVDLLPTLAELLGFAAPPELDGRSLVGLMRGASRREPPSYFECLLPRFAFHWESLFGVRSEGWKYIHAPQQELYHLAEDPEELYNLAGAEAERRRAMEEMLFALVESRPALAPSDEPAADPEARRRLEALGYVGGGGSTAGLDLNPRRPEGRRSPVDAVTYLADYHLANGLAGRGRLREAARIYEGTLLPLDPDNPSFLTGLANLERRLGRPERAFELFRKAQGIDPSDPSILLQLGQLEADRGRLEAAEELYENARRLDRGDVTAAYLWAQSAARQGRPEDAVERYREVLSIDPSHRDSLIDLGVELAKTGDAEGARGSLAAALEAAPFSSRALYNLGLLELQGGRAGAAVEAFERALRYRRSYPAARLGLAAAKLDAGDREGGRAELERLLEETPQGATAERARALLESL
jgi:arylsulfatase A-like enzyme/Tfp pilus assembly protein PilF